VTAPGALAGNGGWLADERIKLAWRLLSIGALAYLAVRWALLLPDRGGIHGVDARTYWGASLDNPYPGPQVGLPGAYLYSPAFLQALTPLRVLPWEVFHAIWTGLGIAAAVFLVGPIAAALAITLLPFVYRDLFVGNIHLMLGVAIVLGFQWPGTWAFVLLTKVTPGIGLLWFAVRREWRSLAVALGVTAAVSLISFVLAPYLWFDWVNRLRGDSGTAGSGYLLGIVVRVAVAAALVAIGARTNRAWLVPVASMLAIPIIWPDSLAILLAAPHLIAHPPQQSRS
jgi:Glycosyltransferase family 87